MKTMMRWLIVAALFGAPAVAQAQAYPCAYDRPGMLAMDIDTFDQAPEGWRSVAARKGCEAAAADLIAAYRRAYDGALRDDGMGTLLYWHEGQLRGHAGQTERAIAAMNASRKRHDAVWNFYVDATVAFLRGDLAAVRQARQGMLALAEPTWHARLAAEEVAQGRMRPQWPMNIEVVEGLIGCFGQPYASAYGDACRARFANE